MVYKTDRKRSVQGAKQKFAPIAGAIRRKPCAQNVMQSIFWGIAVEISTPLISSLENVKISLPETLLPFPQLTCYIYFCTEEMWNSSMRYFFYL